MSDESEVIITTRGEMAKVLAVLMAGVEEVFSGQECSKDNLEAYKEDALKDLVEGAFDRSVKNYDKRTTD